MHDDEVFWDGRRAGPPWFKATAAAAAVAPGVERTTRYPHM